MGRLELISLLVVKRLLIEYEQGIEKSCISADNIVVLPITKVLHSYQFVSEQAL